MKQTILFLLWPLAAWQLAGQTATVEGKVLDTLRGTPIKNVSVSMRSLRQSADAPEGQTYATQTDANGHFVIHNVPAGEYYGEADLNGLIQVRVGPDYYQKFAFTAGQHALITLRMTPAAVISGRVVDADGEPVRDANVGLGHYSSIDGKDLDFSPAATTDDRGEYRLSQVQAGKYYPRAFPPNLVDSPWARDFQRARGFWFVPTYLPSTIDVVQAISIVVAAGSETRLADIVLRAERRYSVRGKFADFQNSRRYWVLLREMPESHHYQIAVNFRPPPPKYYDLDTKVTGEEFEIRDVSPGHYSVIGTASDANPSAQSLVARQVVEVTDHDVENVVLTFASPFEIPGQIKFDGAPFDTSGLMIALMWDWQDRHEVNLKSETSFTFTGVRPEIYAIELGEGAPFPIGSSGPYLKSARLGDRELVDWRVDLTDGPKPLTLVFANEASTIDGTVRDARGRLVSAKVVIVPENAHQLSMPRPRVSASDEKGAFTLRQIPPGEYRLFAAQGTTVPMVYGFDLVKPYLGQSIRITVKPKSSQIVNLQMISRK